MLLAVWFALHGKDMRLFQPRTMLPPVGCVSCGDRTSRSVRSVGVVRELIYRIGCSARAPDLPNSPIGWFKGVVMAPDALVLEAQGPDAYFFLRYIRYAGIQEKHSRARAFLTSCGSLGVFIFAGFFIVTWLILMPVVGTSDGGGTGVS